MSRPLQGEAWQNSACVYDPDHRFPLASRIRAARILGGFGKPEDLVAAMADDARGIGRTNLYAFERGAKVPEYAQLAEIAHVCGLPVEWFTADLDRLAEISADPRRTIAEVRASAKQSATEAAARGRQRRAESRGPSQGSRRGADEAAQG